MTTEERVAVSAVQELIFGLIVALVDAPEIVSVDAGFNAEGCLALDVTVDSDDIGKVVGKQGRMARSLRTILAAVGGKAKLRCELNINGFTQRGKVDE